MENEALHSPEMYLLETDNSGIYAVLRSSADQKVLVLVNLKGTPISDYQLSLNESVLSDGTVTLISLFEAEEAIPVTISDGKFSGYKPIDELIPHQSYIFQFD